LLLARIRPGTHSPGGDDPVAVNVAAGLLSSLHRVNPGTFPFPALEKIYVRMADRARSDAEYEQRTRGDPARGAAGVQRLEAARAAARDLCATTGRTVLLHGDFLDKNLLWDGARYLAIDPIPCIGDPCADAGFFAAGHPPAITILERADAIAAQMGEPTARATVGRHMDCPADLFSVAGRSIRPGRLPVKLRVRASNPPVARARRVRCEFDVKRRRRRPLTATVTATWAANARLAQP
jgi:hypothetical protein